MVNEAQIREWLENVSDPEIPVLSVNDLGIIRDVLIHENEVVIHITPTYSGCPAMDMLSSMIKMELLSRGVENIRVLTVLSPPWTTDWMTENGKRKLREYGITPPQYRAKDDPGEEKSIIPCPLCSSSNTELISLFGSTSCKALYRCKDCLEPFDYFKCH